MNNANESEIVLKVNLKKLGYVPKTGGDETLVSVRFKNGSSIEPMTADEAQSHIDAVIYGLETKPTAIEYMDYLHNIIKHGDYSTSMMNYSMALIGEIIIKSDPAETRCDSFIHEVASQAVSKVEEAQKEVGEQVDFDVAEFAANLRKGVIFQQKVTFIMAMIITSVGYSFSMTDSTSLRVVLASTFILLVVAYNAFVKVKPLKESEKQGVEL